MKSLQQILKSNSLFPKLMHKSQHLQALDKIMRNFMEAELARHCKLAEIKEEKEVILVADNSSWATRLRYAIPEILKNIKTQPEFKNVKKIRYRIKSEEEMTSAAIPKREKPKISQQNEVLWKATLEKLKKKIN